MMYENFMAGGLPHPLRLYSLMPLCSFTGAVTL